MERSSLALPGAPSPARPPGRDGEPSCTSGQDVPFDELFVDLFATRFRSLFRYLDRLSGEPDLAADLAQETFTRLHARGTLPDKPEAWLVTVAMNLFRNVKATRARRRRLMTISRAEAILADPPPSPGQSSDGDSRARVRAALELLSERDRQLLLLLAEGYRYRDMAGALDLNEGSVGTLLARAKRAFRNAYAEAGGRWE